MKKLWELFFVFFKIGIFTIGGGMAMLPLVHNTVVEKKKWLTEDEMLDCIAISQSIPGAVIINAATYIGKKMKGFPGSIAATFGVVLPSFICIILIMKILNIVGENQYLSGFFKGALAAAAGLVSVTLIKMGKIMFRGVADIFIAVTVFMLVIVFNINVVWIILGSIVVGPCLWYLRRYRQRKNEGRQSHE